VSSSLGAQSISGLASGLNTASIVSALMVIAKQPQVQIQNKITVEQARQQAYKDVLAQLKSLTSSYQALTDPITWADVQSTSSSDDAHVSATRTGGAAAGAYAIQVTQLARANQFTVSAAAAADVIHIATSSGTTDVNISAGDTLDTIASKVNGTNGSPVYATVLNGNLVLSNKQTGTAAKITGVTTNGGSGLNFAETQTAQDASFTIDGNAHSSGSNIVTDALAGITLTLKGATTSPATITVGEPAPDTKTIEDKLNAFVTQYNTTLGFIQGKLDEQPVPNASTAADRAKGVLNGDSSLESLLGQLRNAFSDVVSGQSANYQSLAQVGLSTGAAVGTGNLSSDSIDGKLTLNTTAFESALNSNFDQVKSLFNNFTGSYSTEGLAQRLQGILQPYTNDSLLGGILNQEIDSEASQITELQGQVSDWDQRLSLKQQMYEQQFTAMETALSQAQSQSSWLSGEIAKL
jgi:flagellar hook-associated protein 2